MAYLCFASKVTEFFFCIRSIVAVIGILAVGSAFLCLARFSLVSLRYFKPDIIRNGVDRPVGQPPERPESDYPQASMVKAAIIPSGHDVYSSHCR